MTNLGYGMLLRRAGMARVGAIAALTLALIAGPGLARAGAADRPAVPDEADLSAAEKEVKDIHKADFAKKRPADMQALAEKLLKEGLETKDKPAARFVLLREARDLAARAGDLPLAMKAAEEIANHFAVDPLAMKAAAVDRGHKAAATAGAHQAVAAFALALADAAAEADGWEAAEHLAKVALASVLTAATCRELLAHESKLWAFVWCEGVEPTNNAAERALRHAVLWRKGSGGTDSRRGSRFVERVLSVRETCRQQGRSLWGYLVECCQARLAGTDAPSLVGKNCSGLEVA